MVETRLVKSDDDRVAYGVAGGLAHYLDVETWIVRAGFVVLSLTAGIGIGIYLILTFVLPTEIEMAQEEGGGMLDAAALRSIRHLKRDHAIWIAAILFLIGLLIMIITIW